MGNEMDVGGWGNGYNCRPPPYEVEHGGEEVSTPHGNGHILNIDISCSNLAPVFRGGLADFRVRIITVCGPEINAGITWMVIDVTV